MEIRKMSPAWILGQKATQFLQENKMTERRKSLLDSIYFKWMARGPRTNTAKWEEMYQRLLVYKAKHEDTNVPHNYKKDPNLGNWVGTQRLSLRLKKMAVECKSLLNYKNCI